MGGGLFLLVFIAIGAFVFANLVVAVVVTNLVSECCFSTLIYFLLRRRSVSFTHLYLSSYHSGRSRERTPSGREHAVCLGSYLSGSSRVRTPSGREHAVCQASYQNGSDMRPREVQKLDCRLRELAQLQINTGNAKKTRFFSVWLYWGVLITL